MIQALEIIAQVAGFLAVGLLALVCFAVVSLVPEDDAYQRAKRALGRDPLKLPPTWSSRW